MEISNVTQLLRGYSMMPKDHKLLKTDSQIIEWFASTRFNGDLSAGRKFVSNWRHQWNKNGNRFKTGDLIFEGHKNKILKYLKRGGTIAQIKKQFKISINHIKRVISELTQEKRVYRIRVGKAFMYVNKKTNKLKIKNRLKESLQKRTKKCKLKMVKKSIKSKG